VCCVLRAACCVRAVRCKIRGRFVRNRFALQRQTDRQLVECCTCICALAAALVMAGTGDVPLLRTLRALRGRVDQDVQYGHHMAVASAIGFLFLGGGRATLSTSNEAIAAAPPPLSRTDWTRLVPPPVLTGHVSSFPGDRRARHLALPALPRLDLRLPLPPPGVPPLPASSPRILSNRPSSKE
jgi:hypothetical protein